MLHRGAAPDAQAGRGVAVGADVERRAFLFEERGKLLGEVGLAVVGQGRDARIDHPQAHRGVGADGLGRGQEFHPRGLFNPGFQHGEVRVGAALQLGQPADRLAPFQGVEIVLHAQHGRGVDRRALKDVEGDLAALGHAEEFRHRPGGRIAFQPGDRAGREDQHAVRALAAHGLLPGESHHIELGEGQVLGEGGRGRVADGHAFAGIRNKVAVRDTDARGGAVPGEDQVLLRIDLGQVRQLAVGGVQHLDVGQFQLLGDVRHPVLAEGFEGQQLHGPRAQHRPHGHLDGAGVRARDDADQIVGRDLQHLAGAVDGFLQPRLAQLGAVRAAENGAVQIFRFPSGSLGARAGRELGTRRAHGRLGGGGHIDVSHPYR